MDSQLWQQLQQQGRPAAVASPTSLPMGEVPMKGVILANRKTIFHKTRVCPRLSTGACHLGSKCNFAHSADELRPAPNLDKTKLCPSVLQPGTVCPAKARGEVCRFAHSKAEIRHTSNMFKTNMCLKWIRGKCKKDLQCNHAHGHQELKYYRSLAMASGSRDFARESEATLPRRRKQTATAAAVTTPSLAGLAEILYASEQQQKRDWNDAYSTFDKPSNREALLNLLARTCGRKPPPSTNDSTTVNGSLAALYDGLLGQKKHVETEGTTGQFAGSPPDDSTSAADESDFSSFSSRTLSDALWSVGSTSASCDATSYHPAKLAAARLPVVSSCAAVYNNNGTTNSGVPIDVDRLLLVLKMLTEMDGSAGKQKQCEGQQEVILPETIPTASRTASLLTGSDSDSNNSSGLELLDSSLARLCMSDPALRRHCYTEPPPGFDDRAPHQQHALLDLDRLASAGLD